MGLGLAEHEIRAHRRHLGHGTPVPHQNAPGTRQLRAIGSQRATEQVQFAWTATIGQ
jgi:hypothetical protein